MPLAHYEKAGQDDYLSAKKHHWTSWGMGQWACTVSAKAKPDVSSALDKENNKADNKEAEGPFEGLLEEGIYSASVTSWANTNTEAAITAGLNILANSKDSYDDFQTRTPVLILMTDGAANTVLTGLKSGEYGPLQPTTRNVPSAWTKAAQISSGAGVNANYNGAEGLVLSEYMDSDGESKKVRQLSLLTGGGFADETTAGLTVYGAGAGHIYGSEENALTRYTTLLHTLMSAAFQKTLVEQHYNSTDSNKNPKYPETTEGREDWTNALIYTIGFGLDKYTAELKEICEELLNPKLKFGNTGSVEGEGAHYTTARKAMVDNYGKWYTNGTTINNYFAPSVEDSFITGGKSSVFVKGAKKEDTAEDVEKKTEGDEKYINFPIATSDLKDKNVTKEDINRNIRYNEEYFAANMVGDGDGNNLAGVFDSILKKIQQVMFAPVGGQNDAGARDSVTYTDPIGQYMEVKDVQNLLLFGKLHPVTKTAVYNRKWNTDYMRFHGQEGNSLPKEGWYRGDNPQTAELVTDGSWENGDVYRVGYNTAKQFLPTLTDPQGADEKLLNTEYTFYRLDYNEELEKERSLWRVNPAFAGNFPEGFYDPITYVINADKQTDLDDAYEVNPTNIPNGVYRLSDIRIWVEDSGDYMYQGDNLQSGGFAEALRVDVPVSALPMEVATIDVNLDEETSKLQYTYSDNLGEIAAKPLRVFYSVGVQDDVTPSGSIDVGKLDDTYVSTHQDGEGYIWFLSNYYSSVQGDASITFSPSDDNRFYVFQKNLALYTCKEKVEDGDTIAAISQDEVNTGKSITTVGGKTLTPITTESIQDNAIQDNATYYIVGEYWKKTVSPEGEKDAAEKVYYVASRKGSDFSKRGDFAALCWYDPATGNTDPYNKSHAGEPAAYEDVDHTNWIVATRVGGFRAGNLAVQTKTDDQTSTAPNYYYPLMSPSSTMDNLVMNAFLGNNGKLQIADTRLLVTKRVANAPEEASDATFDYQVYVDDPAFTGDVSAIVVRYDDYSGLWRQRISLIEAVTDNEGFLLNKDGKQRITADEKGNITTGGGYYVYLGNEEKDLQVFRTSDIYSGEYGGEIEKGDVTIYCDRALVSKLPTDTSVTSNEPPRDIKLHYEWADEAHKAGTRLYKVQAELVKTESAVSYEPTGTKTSVQVARMDLDQDRGLRCGTTISSNCKIRVTYLTKTVKFGLNDVNELYDRTTIQKSSDTGRTHNPEDIYRNTANVQLHNGEGLQFTGINPGKDYRVTEKLGTNQYELFKARLVEQNSYVDYVPNEESEDGFKNDGQYTFTTEDGAISEPELSDADSGKHATFDKENRLYSLNGTTGVLESAAHYVNYAPEVKKAETQINSTPIQQEQIKKDENSTLQGPNVKVGDEIEYEIRWENQEMSGAPLAPAAAMVVVTDPLDKGVDFVSASFDNDWTWESIDGETAEKGDGQYEAVTLEAALGEDGTIQDGSKSNRSGITWGAPADDNLAPGDVTIAYDAETHTVTWTIWADKEQKGLVKLRVKVNKEAEAFWDYDTSGDRNDFLVRNRAEVQVANHPSQRTEKVENPLGPSKTETQVNDQNVSNELTADKDGNLSGPTVKVGDWITYRVTWNNDTVEDNGQPVAADVTVTDRLDPGVSYVEGTSYAKAYAVNTAENPESEWTEITDAAGVTIRYDNPTHTITWMMKDRPAGDYGYVEFKVQVNGKAEKKWDYTDPDTLDVADENDFIIHNKATVQVNNGNLVETNQVDNPTGGPEKTETQVNGKGVTVSPNPDKHNTVTGPQVNVGDTITYDIKWVNSTNAIANVTVIDPLDKGVDFVSASFGNTTLSTDTGGNVTSEDGKVTIAYAADTHTVTWTLNEREAYTGGHVTLTVKVNENAVQHWDYGEGDSTVTDGSNDYLVVDRASVQINDGAKVYTEKVENPLPKTGTLTVSKKVTGEGVNATDTFSFTLTLTDSNNIPLKENVKYTSTVPENTLGEKELDGSGSCTFGLKGGQDITFKDLPIGTNYTVTETKYDGYNVTPPDNSTGTINEEKPNVTIDFENTRVLKPVVITLQAQKQLTHEEQQVPTESYTFSFTLTPSVGNPDGDPAAEVKTANVTFGPDNYDENEVVFENLRFDRPNTYSYTLREDVSSPYSGIEYSSTEYSVKVIVAPEKQGETYTGSLAATVEINGEPVETTPNVSETGDNEYTISVGKFVNKYRPGIVEAFLEGRKTLAGDTLQPGAFTFLLEADQKSPDAPMPESITVSNDGAGWFRFGPIQYTNEGTYTYKITEQPGNGDVIYDASAIYAVVTVKHDEPTSQLKTDVHYYPDEQTEQELESLEFVNTVTNLEVKKTVVGANGDPLSSDESEFFFQVILTPAGGVTLKSSYPYTGFGGKKSGSLELTLQGNGTYTGRITLKHGQSVIIKGLPVGTQYTVTEEQAEGYASSATGEQGTISADKATAEFTNTKTGGFKVTKTVTGNLGNKEKEWHFRVELSVQTVTGTYGEMVFSAGVAEFTLKHNESKTAAGLPAGTTYTVTETEANQDGYTTTATGETGIIPEGDTAEAVFVNQKDETPTPPPSSQPGKTETNPGAGKLVGVGQQIDYKVTWKNYKDREAKVVVTDKLDPGVDYVEGSAKAYASGTELTSATITYPDPESSHTIKWDLGSQDAGAEGYVTFSVTVNADAKNKWEYGTGTDGSDTDVLGEGNDYLIRNRAHVIVDNEDAVTNEVDNPVTEKTEPSPGPDQNVNVGEEVRYQVTWRNTQAAPATVVVTDRLDPGVDFVSASFDGVTLNAQTDAEGNVIDNSAAGADGLVTIAYDTADHTVTWTLLNRQSGEVGTVSLTVKVNKNAIKKWDYENENAGIGPGTDFKIHNRAKVEIGNESGYTNIVDNPLGEPAYVNLIGNKTLDGATPGEVQFAFILKPYDKNPDADPVKTLPQYKSGQMEVQNGADGRIVFFENLEYTVPGTYKYSVTEEVETASSTVRYDTRLYTVTIVITSGNEGRLQAAVSYTYDNGQNAEGLNFGNTTISEPSVDVIIEGTKEFIGGELEDGMFTFSLSPVGGTYDNPTTAPIPEDDGEGDGNGTAGDGENLEPVPVVSPDPNQGPTENQTPETQESPAQSTQPESSTTASPETTAYPEVQPGINEGPSVEDGGQEPVPVPGGSDTGDPSLPQVEPGAPEQPGMASVIGSNIPLAVTRSMTTYFSAEPPAQPEDPGMPEPDLPTEPTAAPEPIVTEEPTVTADPAATTEPTATPVTGETPEPETTPTEPALPPEGDDPTDSNETEAPAPTTDVNDIRPEEQPMPEGATGPEPVSVNNVNSEFRFAPITFRRPGTYLYELTESRVFTPDGIMYDGTKYRIYVTVTETDGELSAEVAYYQVTGAAGLEQLVPAPSLTFTNAKNNKEETSPGNGEMVQVGETIDYEITWANYKSEPAAVTIRDPLDQGVDFVSASIPTGAFPAGEITLLASEENGTVSTEQTVTVGPDAAPVPAIQYSAATHTVTWNLGTQAAGSYGIVRLQVRVNENAAPDGMVQNQAFVKVNGDPEIETDIPKNPVPTPTPTPVVTPTPTPTGGPHKTETDPGDGMTVIPGQQITYAIDWTNYRAEAATVTIRDPLDSNVAFISASDNGVYDPATHTVNWDLGEQPAGASGTVTLQVQVLESAVQAGIVRNQAHVKVNGDPEQDTEIPENPLETPTPGVTPEPTPVAPTPTPTPTGGPHKTETDPGEGETVIPNQWITYEISWTNYRAEAATVTIRDPLDPNVAFISASDGGVYDPAAHTVTWDLGVKAPGESGTVTLRVLVLESAVQAGVVKNQAHVQVNGDPEQDTEIPENPLETPTPTPTPTGGPHKTETDPGEGEVVIPNQWITYEISWTNYRTEAATVTIRDPLDPNVAFISASDGGVYDPATHTVTWNLGEQPAGASGTVTLRVLVLESAVQAGVVKNQAHVQVNGDPEQDTEIPENPLETPTPSVSPEPSITPEPSVSPEPVASPTPVNPTPEGWPHKTETDPGDGQTVIPNQWITYAIDWVNYRAEAATVTIRDPLDPNVAFISASDGGAYDPATHTVTWNLGVKAPGESGTVTLRVQVLESALQAGIVKNQAHVRVENDPERDTEIPENPLFTPTPGASPTPTAPTPVGPETPKTGDGSTPGFWLAMLAAFALGLGALGGVTLRRRKKNR